MTGAARKLRGMLDIAGAAHDQQLGIILAQLRHEALDEHRFIHGEHDREGVLDPQPVHRIPPGGIAEGGTETIALRALDQVGIGVDRNIGLVMRLSICATNLPTRPAPTITPAASSAVLGQFGDRFDPPGDDAAEPREQRRDRQADRGDDLPELRRSGLDQQAELAAERTISVVSDGLAMSMPVSAAVLRRAPINRRRMPVTSALNTRMSTTAVAIVGEVLPDRLRGRCSCRP